MRLAGPLHPCILARSTMSGAHDWPLEPSLLFSLDALLQERHVSRAAARVGLTQPAMSRVLGRLREQLRDPLLVRTGRGMTLSPRAEAMAAPLRRALDDLGHALSAHQSFDPATSQRGFHLATLDYGVASVVIPLMSRIAAEAPRVDISVQPLRDDFEQDLQTGALDFVLAPRRASAGSLVWTRVRVERFVSLVRGGHPGVGEVLDLDAFCALPHVTVVAERRATSRIDDLLAERGRSRRVALQVPSFLAAPLVVARSEMILTTAESVARQHAEAFSLRVLETPLPLGPMKLSLAWHERQRADPGHAWLRALIAEVAGQ